VAAEGCDCKIACFQPLIALKCYLMEDLDEN
jgi:hypothetical protein